MDPYEPDYAALMGDEESVNPADLVRMLRKQESMGVLGMGAPGLAPQAQATLGQARGRLGDINATKQAVLKRALWSQGRAAEPRPDEAMLAQAEKIGIDRATANLLTARQLQGLFGSQTQRAMADEAARAKAMTPEAMAERDRRGQEAALEAEERRVRITKGRQDIETKGRENEGAGLMGTDWELGPKSPLKSDPTLKREFLNATSQVRTAKKLAAELKGMLKGGLGVMSSADDLTRAESIVRRLQLIGKEVDKLGVLSAVDITKFVEPQLMNPTDFKAAALKGFGRFDPYSQVDQYLQNIMGKVAESADAWDVRPTAGGSFAPAGGAAPASGGGVRKFQRVNGKLVEVK